MNRRSFLTCVTLAAVCWIGLPAVRAQDTGPKQDSRPQAEPASKTVKFATVSPTGREYKDAREATDLEGARKLVGKPATFKGTVVEVLAPDGSNIVILGFAKDYKSALAAVVRRENFARFPRLEDLKGKTVVFTSRVAESDKRPEVELIRPGQLKTVE